MKLLSLSVIMLALSSALLGQSVPGQIKRVFRVMTTVGSIHELKFDPTSRDTVTLDIRGTLSTPQPMPETGPLILYREIAPPPGSPPGSQPAKQTVATIEFPADLTQAIVVIIASPDASYQTYVLPDDTKALPSGMMRVVNLSRMPAALSLNKTVYPIAPGKSLLAPYPAGPLNIQVAVHAKGRWTLALDKGRIARADLRAQAFIFNYEKDRSLDDDGPPPPALVRFYTEASPSPGTPAR